MSVSAPNGPMHRSTLQSCHKPVALAIKYQAPVLGRYNPTFETIWRVNTAVQLLLALIVTEPSVQSVSPFQPEKTEALAGAGVSFTTVPCANSAPQLVPQLIPPTLLVTVPTPVPVRDTVKLYEISLNEAAQDLLAFMVTEPSEQSVSPLQPVNIEPALGMACRLMLLALEKVAEHLVPQSMPVGELTIFPLPLPAAVIVPTVLTVNV